MTPGRIIYIARRRLKLGFHHWRAERLVARRIDRWVVEPGLPLAPLPVHLLTSKHDWRLALWMLASFHHFTRHRWEVILHEDGSLGTSELDIFQQLFPNLRVVRRMQADDAMAPILAKYPRCADYRRRMPHGLKSFDIPQLATTPRFLMLDPDIIFYAEPVEILKWVDDPHDLSCWFNADFQEPSPIPPSQALDELGVKLWTRVNSGLALLTRVTVTDLEAMEEWLGHSALQEPKVQWRVEQTLLALSGSRGMLGGLLPASYEVSPDKHRRTGCIARHYVGCVRDRFLSEGVIQLARDLKI